MPSSQAITATCTLRSAAGVEQTARQVRQALGSVAVIEQDDGAALVARFGLTAQDGGTQVAVRMTSDQGWYLATISLAHQHYRVRFGQLVADLKGSGMTVTAPAYQQ